MPPCPPGPSHHAIRRGSTLLHRVFKQHIALRIAETHSARPSQPVGTQGVRKDSCPDLPPLITALLSTRHRGASSRAEGVIQ